MRAIVVTPPEPVVTLADAKAHLRVLHSREDDLIERYVAAATGHIDGPKGLLGRAIGAQTLELRLNSFACTNIRLPYPEINSVTSIAYLDAAGAEQTMAAEDYEQTGDIVAPRWGTSWPATRYAPEAVRIRYEAGYRDEPVPEPIRAAILVMTADQYQYRESAAAGINATVLRTAMTVESLLERYMVYR